MYAVIKTGGKQYRVQPGDVLVVEKLDGDAGAEISFDQVLAMGEGDSVMLGAPLVAGALVTATLVETRKGEKVKIFKKIRRQGYRRTKGHRQPESVLRVMSIAGGGKSEKWDGKADLTTRAVLNARARGLKAEGDTAAPAKTARAPKTEAPEAVEPKTAPKTATKKAAAPKAEAKTETKAKAPKAKAAAPKASKAGDKA